PVAPFVTLSEVENLVGLPCELVGRLFHLVYTMREILASHIPEHINHIGQGTLSCQIQEGILRICLSQTFFQNLGPGIVGRCFLLRSGGEKHRVLPAWQERVVVRWRGPQMTPVWIEDARSFHLATELSVEDLDETAISKGYLLVIERALSDVYPVDEYE